MRKNPYEKVRIRAERLDCGGAGDKSGNEIVRAMSFEKCGGLREEMAVQILSQLEHGRLPNPRHQVGREVLCDTLCDRESNQQDRDHLPGAEGCLGD